MSGEYYSTVGVRAVLGRVLDETDDRPGAPLVAVVSYDFWSGALGGDPTIVGQSLLPNGERFEFVGVPPLARQMATSAVITPEASSDVHVRMVLTQVLGLTAIGLAIGLLAAYQVGPVVSAMLYGVEPGDALTMATAALVMAAVAEATSQGVSPLVICLVAMAHFLPIPRHASSQTPPRAPTSVHLPRSSRHPLV